MIRLREMDDEALRAWLPVMWDGYFLSLVRAGASEAEARSNVDANRSRVMDGDLLAAGHVVFRGLDDDRGVGTLWLAPGRSGDLDEWFVYDVEVDEELRGRGYGRAMMEAAEAFVRERGASRLSLNVFGDNHVARGLYESLGYQVMAVTMFKELSPEP